MKSKRIKWLDFARGIAILFVVLGHGVSSVTGFTHIDSLLFKPMNAIIFTIAMPCFFAISGYLYKRINNVHAYILMFYKKLISLGFPYIIFSILYVFLQHCGGNNVHQYNQYSNLIYIYKDPISYMWFLYALFFMFIIIGFLDLLRVNIFIQFLLYMLMMIISIIYPNLLPSGFTLTCNNIIYFYLGYVLSTGRFKQWITYFCHYIKLNHTTAFFSLISLFVLSFIIQLFFTPSNYTNNSTFSDFITKCLSIVLLIIFSKHITNRRFFTYFDKYGKITLIIYLIHWPAISVVRVLLLKILPINNITVILIYICLVILAWYISLFVCYLSKLSRIINFIFYPRKRYISPLINKTAWGKNILKYTNKKY